MGVCFGFGQVFCDVRAKKRSRLARVLDWLGLSLRVRVVILVEVWARFLRIAHRVGGLGLFRLRETSRRVPRGCWSASDAGTLAAPEGRPTFDQTVSLGFV